MRILILTILMSVCLGVSAKTQRLMELPPFERAVVIIKHYETMHDSRKHWPYVGYGHQVQPGEPYYKGCKLTEKQADALLRKDLRQFCSMFRHMGADSLLLGVLAYNVGPYRILGSGTKYAKSKLLKKLESGDRNIFADYLRFCRYNGKPHAGIKRRRFIEFQLLYLK